MKSNMFDSWVGICGPSKKVPIWTIHLGSDQAEGIIHACESKKEAERLQEEYRELFRWIAQEVLDELYNEMEDRFTEEFKKLVEKWSKETIFARSREVGAGGY